MLKKAVTMLCCAFLWAAVSARADEWNKKTTLTFSQPVELPGVVLPAGTYVFKLLDSSSDRHIVQVFSQDEKKIFATILAIPNYRLTPKEDTVVGFAERVAGAPEAVRAWFYPGDNFGQEFVYPKFRATNLAAETQVPVLSAAITPEERPEELIKAPVETIAPPEKEAVVEAPPPAPGPVPEVAPAPVVEAAPVETAPLPELPKTASPLVLIALFGGLCFGLALSLKHAS